jgi:hypothetical protein
MVTWSVNNTDGTNGSTVNAANVKITLSTDGGATFPTTIVSSTANTGSATVTMPNIVTTTARIKVEAVGNIFFDMSNTNFTITAGLPVELMTFNARLKNKNEAALTWATASEKNNLGFEVEMLDLNSSAKKFEKMGFVKGNGTTAAANNYAFSVSNLLPSTYYFRLKQMDMDGTVHYSGVQSVTVSGNGFDVKLFPNPAKNDVNVDLYLEKESEMSLQLVNQIGQIVLTLPSRKYESGRQTLLLNTTSLPSGIYFYRCEAARQSLQGKILIVK